ncbi:MAG: M48 family metalloprotease [archaeon]
MSLIKLRLSMVGTLTIIIAASTLFLTVVMSLMGTLNVVTLAFFVIFVNVAQWLLSPYLIGMMYRTREVTRADNPRLHSMVEQLSQKLKMKMPKLMIANIPIPNAFAYGSPLAGNRVALTTGLMKELEEEEVEAVIGHELGHLKHRDMQIMMFASVLPALFYYLGYSTMLSSWYGGGRRREQSGATPILIGMTAMAVYWVLTLLTLSLSRLREYYADQASVSIVDDGARKLSEGLAKIVAATSRGKKSIGQTGGTNGFKTLFISDPDCAEKDIAALTNLSRYGNDQRLVQDILSRKVSAFDRFLELLSTHPNMVKRLQALRA